MSDGFDRSDIKNREQGFQTTPPDNIQNLLLNASPPGETQEELHSYSMPNVESSTGTTYCAVEPGPSAVGILDPFLAFTLKE